VVEEIKISKNNTFSNFHNLYSLSKTLRFELKPIGNTQQMLEDNKVFKKDETIYEKYQATKPYIDRLHREFVQDSFKQAKLSSLYKYFDVFKKWKNDKKVYEKELQVNEKALRKQIVEFFNTTADQWAKQYSHLKLKKKNIEILFEEGVFEILQERYGKEEEAKVTDKETQETISIFKSWKGFTGYFTKFFETRENFYKDDGKATALATRIIDQNLKRFCDNILVFESLKDLEQELDFSEVEKGFNVTLSEIFSVDYYNNCLLQQGIDLYNSILGADSKDQNKRGINQIINEYKQQTGKKLPFFKNLDKQILSEQEEFVKGIENEIQLLKVLQTFQQTAEQKTKILKNLFKDFVDNQGNFDLDKIYITKEAFNTISRKWTNETELLEDSLYTAFKNAKVISSSAKKKDGGYSFPDFIALSFIKNAFENTKIERIWKERYYKNQENAINNGFLTGKEKIWDQFLKVFEFEFFSLFNQSIIDSNTGKELQEGYEFYQRKFEALLENFNLDKEAKIIIKNFADEVLHIYQMAKYFAVVKKGEWKSEYDLDVFYTDPNNGYLQFYDSAYEEIVQIYNDIRNYLTKKPYSQEKWKLNFENSTLANGWDKNKESDNFAVVLRKNGAYYLGLMNRGCNKIFDDKFQQKFVEDMENGKYEKMVYKFFPDQAKMFPKVCFSAKGVEFFQPSKEIWNIYKNSEFKKGDSFSVKSMQKLIDFYKDCLTKYEGWGCYKFEHIKPTKFYTNNIGEFFRDVAENGYQITFQDISEKYINEKNKNGELYLFQIKNKDWNDGATGTKNLHTLYFESVFSTENIAQNFPIKLNGQAEVFYRPKTEVDKLEYRENQDKSVKTFIDKRDENKEKKVIKNRRYSEDKIFFHVPLTLNRTKSNTFQFNAQVNNFLAQNPDINIIGIDRGEKHLAYYSVINQIGEVFESGSLNFVGQDPKGNPIDYHKKLEIKAEAREQARKDWQDVEGIKDLKRGYISQVVKKLADLAIKHNAIIVFEDLNMRFKQIRGGIEKSVYQQLEKALIEKLNFLVNKGEKDPEQAGHLLKAYQLTAPFETFQKMGKQTGIIFYTQAAYTSKIDPVTGWRPNLYLKYSSAEKAKQDITNFTKIEYINNRFEFTYNITEFKKDQKEYAKNTVWTVCSSVERFRWNRKNNQNKGGYDYYSDVTTNLLELFKKYRIDIKKGDILSQIKNTNTKGNEIFFKDLIFYLNLICQIRNTDEKAGDINKQDFILSPVKPFFDSRTAEKFGKNLPKNGDDNGAYNIARKGIIILDKISTFAKENDNCDKMKWGDLYVSNTEWDNFASA